MADATGSVAQALMEYDKKDGVFIIAFFDSVAFCLSAMENS